MIYYDLTTRNLIEIINVELICSITNYRIHIYIVNDMNDMRLIWVLYVS